MNAESLIGQVLGTCTLQRLVGQGGMGAVFLAQQSRPRRQVAVKVLLPANVQSSAQRVAFLERFRRETDAAAALEHPYILPVHEYGEREGLAYLVMPYIRGGTLREELEQQGSLPLIRTMSYLEQMAAALDFAHSRGVIHRDVKPANILKTPDGRLLLSDFGLVKIIAEGQSEQARLTGNGGPIGTPDYMAPEQALGVEGVSARSDVYALGVVLYHMVTGKVPFQGDTPMQVAMQHIHTPPPSPRAARADLPPQADRVMLKALAKRPIERYAQAGELAVAFREALIAAGVRLDALLSTPQADAEAKSPGARLFTSRSLFDPMWRSERSETALERNTPAQELPVVHDEPEPVEAALPMQKRKQGLDASAFARVKTPESAKTRATPLPAVRERYTPLPPTPLKLRPKGEGLSMFQKPKLHGSPSKTPENQHAAFQGSQPNAGPQNGDATVPFQTQAQPGMPQPIPGMNTHASGQFDTMNQSNNDVPPFAFNQPGTMNGPVPFRQPFAPGNTTRHLGNPNASANVAPPFAPTNNAGASAAFPSGNTTQQWGGPAMPPPSAPKNATHATRTLGDPNMSPAGGSGVFPPPNARGNTGALVPYQGQGMTGAMKLAHSVKVVQVPVAGQPGRYMTGFLPVLPKDESATAEDEQNKAAGAKKRVGIALVIIAVAVVLLGSGLYFLVVPHSGSTTAMQNGNTTPGTMTTAQAIAQATAQANTILADPMTYNSHNWPVVSKGNPQFAFKDDGYHVIVNGQSNNAGLPLLPNETYSNFGYTVTMQEAKGDDGSEFNFYGIVLRYSAHGNNKTFYLFDYQPSNHQYEFREYVDNGHLNGNSPWTVIWHHGVGKEFHTGHGAKNKNTLKVAASGRDFTFLINGKQVGTAQDKALKSGQIGMMVNKSGSEVAYSNLLLTNK
ncbi:MAG TPA: protein kinase [Ktedonobacteraceae bacterium]|nr:protein kinase [Ktedonobacteraceae bacterium]